MSNFVFLTGNSCLQESSHCSDPMHVTFLQSLHYIVLFILGFISLFLLTNPKGQRVSNMLLAGCFLVWLFVFVDAWAFSAGFYRKHVRLAFFANQAVWLFGPLYWLYIKSRVSPGFRWRNQFFVHVVPFLAVTAVFQVAYQSASFSDQKAFIEIVLRQREPSIGVGLVLILVTALIFIHMAAYLMMAFRAVREYRSNAGKKQVDSLNLSWLHVTLLSFSFLLIGALIHNVIRIGASGSSGDSLFMSTLLIGVTSTILFASLRNSEVFSDLSIVAVTKKSKGASLPEDTLLMYSRQLESIMVSEKPYLDPDLSMQRLAKQLSWPARTLSQVVNQGFGQNYFDYINRYRIEEAVRLLRSPEYADATVLHIMYDVGFNSKSSFNTAFKKHTGMTPSQAKP